MYYRTLVFLALGLSFLLFACGKDYLEEDRLAIQEYLAENGLVAQETPEGLFYIIDEEGTGDHPDLTSFVKVHYEGRLLNGTKFDSSYDRGEASEFFLTQVIQGWQIGIPLLKKGGKGQLFIPSPLGYGSRASGGIPANSVLVFDVELIDF